MPLDYTAFATEIRRLAAGLAALEPLAARVGVAAPAGQEWFELLRRKLLPQLNMPPALIVAIVGGTNIGKSAIFNHLAGEVASASTPLAAGTKHPVCLVPPEFDNLEVLSKLFEPFVLAPWHSPDDPLGDTPENRLFWRIGQEVPQQLLLLDAPYVDSDATVNWQRATAVRQTADVLVAVLTQQKYNDAAVKQFFRAAAEADKPIVVIFNLCDLEADRDYWPQWLATFCAETGARPELVYVVPYDRAAANDLRLPFFPLGNAARAAVDLRRQLAAMHFDAIKIRTFRGAVDRVLDRERGLPAYLATISSAAAEFSAAATVLSANEMARVAWPPLPASVLVDEIHRWWDASRTDWSRQIHGAYRLLGQGVTWPIRKLWNSTQRPADDPLTDFRQHEQEAVLMTVAKLLDELERLAEVGNAILRPRLQTLLGGHARARLLRDIESAHQQLPAVDEDYRAFVLTELDAWKASNPRAVRLLTTLDHAAAMARPAITISLFVSGWVLAGDLVGQAAMQAAGHTAGHLATEAAIAGGITGGGEALVNTTGQGVRQAAGRLFRRLQTRYAQQRAAWLAAWLERELLGDLLADLRRGAEVPESQEFSDLTALGESLRNELEISDLKSETRMSKSETNSKHQSGQ